MTPSAHGPRSIAFYLPQFHPIPENDEWWGPGFTEWTNVVPARPMFGGHEQPHLPADLGFYDLRVPEVRAQQAELAAAHGIDAFCYYHYWFAGRRLLERPISEVLASQEPDLPLCLCWANESWTRTWNGKADVPLLTQTYSAEDDLTHARHLAEVFADRRYVCIDGRPLFLVYRTSELPDARRTSDAWRAEVTRLGVAEPYLCAVQSGSADHVDPAQFGFDAAVEFAIDFTVLGRLPRGSAARRLARHIGLGDTARVRNRVASYDDVVREMLAKAPVDYIRYRCVSPGFDNSPRRPGGGATILTESTPPKYGAWLEAVVRQAVDAGGPSADLVFVNAWNEWGEGNHLEPSQRWGTAYLEAHAAATERAALPAQGANEEGGAAVPVSRAAARRV